MEGYLDLYRRAEQIPRSSGAKSPTARFTGLRSGPAVLEWKPPIARWFVGAKTNVSYNCLDRHHRHASQKQSRDSVGRRARRSALHHLSGTASPGGPLRQRAASPAAIKAGDRAIVYMPMIPELPIAMLACARLGIIHSVVFGGFSAEALKARIQDLGAALVITADGGFRRGKEVKLKPAVDEALAECPTVRDVIVYQAHRLGHRDASRARSLVARSRRARHRGLPRGPAR